MRIVPALAWRLEDGSNTALDARLIPLLEAIAASASLAAAVDERGISYRAAWGLLRDYERTLGEPLVLLARGRGAALTATGTRLLDLERAATRQLAASFAALATDLGAVTPIRSAAPVATLRTAASHDLVLAALAGSLPAGCGFALELSFMGSLHALAAYAEGRADLAGFHVPIGSRPEWDRAPFLRGLRANRDRLIRLVDRDQGLMLPSGNPAQVRQFSDLAARGLRFINRQTGSGTRLVIDRLLIRDRIDRSTLVGYGNEEFTHRAVAATIASGGADAGFGLRAAAAEQGLAFVPLVSERYFLAVRARSVDTEPIRRLLDVLRSRLLARIARRFAGYRANAAGALVGVDALGTSGKTPRA